MDLKTTVNRFVVSKTIFVFRSRGQTRRLKLFNAIWYKSCLITCSNKHINIAVYIEDEDVDDEVLSSLTERALESLVFRIGPRMELLKVVQTTKYGIMMSQSDNRTLGVCPSLSLSLSSLLVGELRLCKYRLWLERVCCCASPSSR